MSPAELPAAVQGLLLAVVADGFVLRCCGPRDAPAALVASYEWDQHLDLITIRDFARITTARVLTRGRRVDVFAPEVAVWAYEGDAQPALKALLGLVHPAHPDAPTVQFPAPAGLHVPRAEQRPITIRMPPAGCKAARAARLGSQGKSPVLCP